MSLLSKKKAEEIIDLCLAEESPEHKSRVLEILAMSEIEPNDPLFLALLATGNLRVYFEQGLVELKKAMIEIDNSASEVKAFREQIKSSSIEVNSLLLERLKAEHEQFISNAIDSNSEALRTIRESLNELSAVKSELKSERAEHIRVMKSLIDGMSKTITELDRASLRFESMIKRQGLWFAVFNKLKRMASLLSTKTLIQVNIWKLFGGGLIFFVLIITSYFLVLRPKDTEEASSKKLFLETYQIEKFSS